MRNIQKKLIIVLSATALVLILSVFASLYYCDWQWFSRSGSLLIIIGLLSSFIGIQSNFNIEGGIMLDIFIDHVKAEPTKYGLNTIPSKDEIIVKAKELYEKKTNTHGKLLAIAIFLKIELYIALLGTFIWGYGDLLNYFFK